jgi:hypothetical protein
MKIWKKLKYAWNWLFNKDPRWVVDGRYFDKMSEAIAFSASLDGPRDVFYFWFNPEYGWCSQTQLSMESISVLKASGDIDLYLSQCREVEQPIL